MWKLVAKHSAFGNTCFVLQQFFSVQGWVLTPQPPCLGHWFEVITKTGSNFKAYLFHIIKICESANILMIFLGFQLKDIPLKMWATVTYFKETISEHSICYVDIFESKTTVWKNDFLNMKFLIYIRAANSAFLNFHGRNWWNRQGNNCSLYSENRKHVRF